MTAKRIYAGILLFMAGLWPTILPAADTPRQQYFQADACYRKLVGSPSRQKYRDAWLSCIRKFDAVHKRAPDSGWAPAGLYMSGRLYLELYRKSFAPMDRNEGRDRLERVINKYPRSAYRDKAKAALADVPAKTASKRQTRGPVTRHPELLRVESDLAKLQKSEKRRKYRHNWQQLINRSHAVYRKNPDGPNAPAALYLGGKLYQEMARYSFLTSDRQEARDLYERVTAHFPTSAFAAEAAKRLTELKSTAPAAAKKKTPQPPPKKATASAGASSQFKKAEAARRRLEKNPRYQKYRDKWMAAIDPYLAAAESGDDAIAAAGWYRAGSLYLGLHGHSFLGEDRDRGLDYLEQVIRTYPGSPYRGKAAQAMRRNDPKRLARIEKDMAVRAASDPIANAIRTAGSAPKASGAPPAAPGAMATVTGLRYWSNPKYTRIVIDADRDATFTHRLLKKDARQKKPQRLYVDLEPARLRAGVQKIIPINDELLSDARAGQNTSDTVRVVIDIKSFRNYKIFSLKNPFRIVIDVWGEEREAAVTARRPPSAAQKKLPVEALAKQLSLGVRRIVIDPGHGGRDYGAPGYYKGVHEKKVVMAIARRLQRIIKKEIGCEVLMTRSGDTYLPLEERTAYANTKNADLFISIHTNAARDSRAYGIETYFLNLATDDEAIRVAALENATSTKNISDLQTILTDLMQNAKINESSRLAAHIQDQTVREMKKKYRKIKNKGVKQAPFYVLLGAQMPAVLVETSFISNSRECKRLREPKYQEQLCRGIVRGIKAYINEANPSAFQQPVRRTGNRKG